MKQEILTGKQAREALATGVDKMVNIVKVTIGPRGRNVMRTGGYSSLPQTTNDGRKSIRNIVLDNPFEEMGGKIAKGLAERIDEFSGGARSTALILLQAILREGLKYVDDNGASVVNIRKSLEKAIKEAVSLLKIFSDPIKTEEDMRKIATISSQSEEVGGIVSNLFKKIGKEGFISVEDGQALGITSKIVDGLELQRGYYSPYFEFDKKDVAVLLVDKAISSPEELVPILEQLGQPEVNQKNILIIAHDIDTSVLNFLVVNNIKSQFSFTFVKCPEFGDRRKDLLEDIAFVTKATVISEEKGMKLEEAQVKMVGKAQRVIVNKDVTKIIGGVAKKTDIAKYVKTLKNRAIADESFKVSISKRIAKILGGVAVISVGCVNETDSDYLKSKIQDAVSETKSALEGGIVAGGGSTLAKIGNILLKETREGEDMIGYKIIGKALEAPLKNIAINSGQGDGSAVLQEVLKNSKNGGFDAENILYVKDMIKEGIIDSVKVLAYALESASAFAGAILTTEVVVADLIKDNIKEND